MVPVLTAASAVSLAACASYAVPEAGVMLNVRRLSPGERTAVPDGAYVYVHVVRGEVRLGDEELTAGDAVRVTNAEALDAVVVTPVEVLLLLQSHFVI